MIVAQTNRLTLRCVTEADVSSLRTVFADPEVMRYGDGPQTDDWIRSWVIRMNCEYNIRGYGLWMVTRKSASEPIGYCGLTWFPDVNGRPEVEIGYRLARNDWNHGFATEAAMAVRDLAFSRFQLMRLIAIIDPANSRSIRVAEKLGMKYHADVMFDGYSHPDAVYCCKRAASAC